MAAQSFRAAVPAAARRPHGRAFRRIQRRSPVAAAAMGGRAKGAAVGLPAMLCVLLASPSAFALAGEERADVIEQFIKEKQGAGFDLDVLRPRGIDPKLADYFRHEARFRAGTSVVTLFVNGERRGLVPATFDADGRLCFDETLRDKAGLVASRGADDAAAGATACDEFQRQFPSTIVELRPGRDEVRLIVPTDAFRARERADTFSSGGVAGLLNYDLLTMDSRHAGGTSSFHSLNTEAGLNVGDWIFRSRQSYTSNNGKEKLQHLYAYGQKTLTGLGSTVQGGQITIASSIFPGDPGRADRPGRGPARGRTRQRRRGRRHRPHAGPRRGAAEPGADLLDGRPAGTVFVDRPAVAQRRERPGSHGHRGRRLAPAVHRARRRPGRDRASHDGGLFVRGRPLPPVRPR
ncbi:hypothetical protein GmRootV118_23270 [Variovorax sp. V118]